MCNLDYNLIQRASAGVELRLKSSPWRKPCNLSAYRKLAIHRFIDIATNLRLWCFPAVEPNFDPYSNRNQYGQPTMPSPTATATRRPSPTPLSPFYLEEFQGDMEGWTYFLATNEKDADSKVEVYPSEGGLWVKMDVRYTSLYLLNTEFDYEDVRMEFETENMGRNNNSISMLCRFTEDVGWYVFLISNSGVVGIYRAELKNNKVDYEDNHRRWIGIHRHWARGPIPMPSRVKAISFHSRSTDTCGAQPRMIIIPAGRSVSRSCPSMYYRSKW